MKRFAILLIIPVILTGILAGSTSAAISDYFVDTDWLGNNIQDINKDIIVVDVRVGAKYLLGHIDGAIHINKGQFLHLRGGVKSLVPTVTEFEALLDKYGIKRNTTVVVYAEHTNPYSSRLVWTLRYHGHENSYVLDGGYEKWKQEGRKASILPTLSRPTEGYKVTGSSDIRAEAGQILTRLSNPTTIVWDTRTEGEYLGSVIRADRGGHIPDAVHLNWVDLQKEVNGIRVLRSEEEIRTILSSKGITKGQSIIAHCQTGIRSSFATLVLLGLEYPEARNYDGSWIEWANNSELPIVSPVNLAKR